MLRVVPESFIICECLQWLPFSGEVDRLPPSNSLPIPSCVWARHIDGEKRAMHTHSCTSLFHHQLSHFSSTHSSPLSLSLISLPSQRLLLVLSIALRLLPPLSLGPGHMQEGRLGRCSSGRKKERGKCSAAISTGGPSPFASLCQKREGFLLLPGFLTLCLL